MTTGTDSAGSLPTPPRDGRRSLFWPGFALGFLLLATLSCGGAVLAFGFTDLAIGDLQGSGTSWTPPAVTPLTGPSEGEVAAAQAGVASTAFLPGQMVRNVTSSRVNIRQTPGFLGKPASDVIAQIEPAAEITILGQSAAADGLVWWLVRIPTVGGGTLDGWVAESTASGVRILAPAP